MILFRLHVVHTKSLDGIPKEYKIRIKILVLLTFQAFREKAETAPAVAAAEKKRSTARLSGTGWAWVP